MRCVRCRDDAGPVSAHRPRVRVQSRAGNGTRTRDPNLGKVVLYQLSYSRTLCLSKSARGSRGDHDSMHTPTKANIRLLRRPSGGEGNRTPDLLNAIQALSQLSYAPGAPLETPNERSHQEPRRIAQGISSVKKSGLAERLSAGILHAAG